MNIQKNRKYFFLGTILTLFPSIAFGAFEGLKELLVDFSVLLNTGVRVLFGLSMVFFLWGLSQFILNAGDVKKKEEGKSKMVWGIVALTVFVSIYGIINWIVDATGLQVTSPWQP